jgi:hypothetical protein
VEPPHKREGEDDRIVAQVLMERGVENDGGGRKDGRRRCGSRRSVRDSLIDRRGQDREEVLEVPPASSRTGTIHGATPSTGRLLRSDRAGVLDTRMTDAPTAASLKAGLPSWKRPGGGGTRRNSLLGVYWV